MHHTPPYQIAATHAKPYAGALTTAQAALYEPTHTQDDPPSPGARLPLSHIGRTTPMTLALPNPLRRAALIATCALTAALALTAQASHADAQDTVVNFGIGLKGGLNLNLLSEPPEKEGEIDLAAPGFVGLGGGGGLALEVLALDIVGIEFDVFYVKAQGEGNLEVNSVDIKQTLESTEWQLPLLLKAQIPGLLVRPHLVIGATFVFQQDGAYDVEETDNVQAGFDTTSPNGLAKNYTMFTAGIGATVDADVVRIPVELRASYKPAPDSAEERADVSFNPPRQAIYPTWEAQVWFLVGVQYSHGL